MRVDLARDIAGGMVVDCIMGNSMGNGNVLLNGNVIYPIMK
jgi:hypothetical protein